MNAESTNCEENAIPIEYQKAFAHWFLNGGEPPAISDFVDISKIPINDAPITKRQLPDLTK